MKKKRSTLLLGIALIPKILNASQEDTLNLLDDLNNASEITTKSKLNINKTPSIVSILYADELKKLGIINLYKALETVPGIEISMGIAGAKQINMRGNKSTVTDKVKLMIDGVSVSNEVLGANFFYLDMPIENIKRIEIIRGPASALYGSLAHIGVINVITKATTYKDDTFFINTSSAGFSDVGFTQHVNNENIKVAIDGFFQNNNNSRNYSNYSLLNSTSTFTSYEDFTNKSVGLHIEALQDFSLQVRFLQLTTQNYYGYGDWPIVQDPKNLEHSSFFSEFKYAPKLSKSASLEFKTGYQQYTLSGLSRQRPFSVQQPKPPYPPYDYIANGYYNEEKIYSDLALKYNFTDHQLLLGTYISYAKEVHTSYYFNNPALSEDTTVLSNGIMENLSRRQYALYFNDIYSFWEKWTLNLGLRYDHYSHIDSGYAPKLAFLYNHDSKQNYKLIYQRSFKAPTWIELYGTQQPFKGNSSLKSETIDTIELAYRYQNTFNNWLNINFFYSNIKNSIYTDSNYKLQNRQDTYSYGTEVELTTVIDNSTKIQANYTYVEMKDNNNKSVPFIANNLANIMLWHDFTKDFNAASKFRYVGTRKREATDTRENLGSYMTLDQTFTYTYNMLTFQTSVKNIFNKRVSYPSPLGNTGSGTYEDDFSRDGRTFWVSLEWRVE